MTREEFKGKTIGEIMGDTAKFLDSEARMKKSWFDEVKQEVPRYLDLHQAGRYATLNDDYHVIIFLDNIPIAMFYVYEVHALSINEKRGVINVIGHETNHEYWFDDGEYSYYHTR